MRHARSDYNRIQDPERLIPDDEPVFLIRAHDKVGPHCVREWAKVHSQNGGDIELSNSARQWADEMDRWQQTHGYKLADVSPEVRAELIAQLDMFREQS